MDNRIVDLHVHSTESDGTFTPTEVIAEAKKAGLSAIALTDHDTATGIRKAMGAAKEAGIELIPGIELSTAYTFPGKKQEKEIREFDTLKSKKVPQSLEIGLFFCQIFIFII